MEMWLLPDNAEIGAQSRKYARLCFPRDSATVDEIVCMSDVHADVCNVLLHPPSRNSIVPFDAEIFDLPSLSTYRI